jgi:hypothetical protein
MKIGGLGLYFESYRCRWAKLEGRPRAFLLKSLPRLYAMEGADRAVLAGRRVWVDFLTVRFRSDATPMDCLGPVPEPPGGAFCRLAADCDASSSAYEALFCRAMFGKTTRKAFNAWECLCWKRLLGW